MDMHTTLSALERFISVTHANYSNIISIANYVLSKAENIHVNLEDEKEKIIVQMAKLQELRQDIDLKLAKYQDALSSAERYKDRCEDVYYSAREDDDRDYLRRVRDDLFDARGEVSRLKDKVDTSFSISSNISSNIEKLEIILNGTNKILEVSNNNVYEIKKHLTLLADEANYNMNSLKELTDSVKLYLSSMKFVSVASGYTSDAEFYSGTSFVGSSNGNFSISSKQIQKKALVVYRVSKEDIKKITKYKEKPLVFQRYSPYYGPIKQMLLNTMMCMGPDFQQFMLTCLNKVVFVRSKNGFIYDTNNKNGRTLRIIGLDITNSYFPVSLYIHVSHNLMHGRYVNEKMQLDQLVAKELKRDVSKANSKLFKLAESIKLKRLNAKGKRRLSNVIFDSSSKFFGYCLKLYVEKDNETLTAIQGTFPESYAMFTKLLDKTIKWK